MVTGSPFKTRSKYGRVNPSVLDNPEPLKYHIPIPFAFVPVNPFNTVDRKTGKLHASPSKKSATLVSSVGYKQNNECQSSLINLNRCLRNIGGEQCRYYESYLNNNCRS